ncbi:transcriptional regulator, GntR family [Sulfobacillus acidophilus TPY]|nr:transcriptional regulator, GntR family [Sulfobacillus acidophilus TPY]
MPQQSSKTYVLELLQRWIVDGTLMDGERISDAAIADRLGISRTPVREALLILESQGFVEIRRGRDTRVRPVHADDLYQLYPPLAALERVAARLAMPRMSSDAIQKLQTINENFARALERRDVFEAMEYDEAFHDLIVDMADNQYIATFVATLQMHIRRLKYRFFSHALPGHTSVLEHQAMIQAFETQDCNTLEITMESNWLRPMQELVQAITAFTDQDG